MGSWKITYMIGGYQGDPETWFIPGYETDLDFESAIAQVEKEICWKYDGCEFERVSSKYVEPSYD